MENFTSEVKIAQAPQQTVYGFLEDCRNIEHFRERLGDAPLSEEQRSRIENARFDRDTITIDAPGIGTVTLQITEREEPKLLRLRGVGVPIDIEAVIQLLPLQEDEGKTRLRVTLKAELNPFIRAMVGGKLRDAADQMAAQLASIPYNTLTNG